MQKLKTRKLLFLSQKKENLIKLYQTYSSEKTKMSNFRLKGQMKFISQDILNQEKMNSKTQMKKTKRKKKLRKKVKLKQNLQLLTNNKNKRSKMALRNQMRLVLKHQLKKPTNYLNRLGILREMMTKMMKILMILKTLKMMKKMMKMRKQLDHLLVKEKGNHFYKELKLRNKQKQTIALLFQMPEKNYNINNKAKRIRVINNSNKMLRRSNKNQNNNNSKNLKIKIRTKTKIRINKLNSKKPRIQQLPLIIQIPKKRRTRRIRTKVVLKDKQFEPNNIFELINK